MKIRRITLTLPVRMKKTAHHDARAIAEALGQTLHRNGAQTLNNGAQTGPITLRGHGQTGSVLATRAAAALPKGGRHGG